MSTEESMDGASGASGRTEPSADEWADALEEGRLLGQCCSDCGHETAAPKAACVRCGSTAIEPVELPTEGSVHAVTDVAVAPSGFDGPYRIAVIDLDGARVMTRLDSEADVGESVALSGVVEVDGIGPVFS